MITKVDEDRWQRRIEFVKPRLDLAFRRMRSAKMLAFQNYQCCSSCAGAAIAARVEKLEEPRRQALQGAAYYHRQDGDVLEGFELRSPLHLRYGQVHVWREDSAVQVYGPNTADVGERVLGCLAAAGLDFRWDFDPRNTIRVTGIHQTIIDAAVAAMRLGGNPEDVLDPARASGNKKEI